MAGILFTVATRGRRGMGPMSQLCQIGTPWSNSDVGPSDHQRDQLLQLTVLLSRPLPFMQQLWAISRVKLLQLKFIPLVIIRAVPFNWLARAQQWRVGEALRCSDNYGRLLNLNLAYQARGFMMTEKRSNVSFVTPVNRNDCCVGVTLLTLLHFIRTRLTFNAPHQTAVESLRSCLLALGVFHYVI
jgi:hypothetical protein